MAVLVLGEHDLGALSPATARMVTAAQRSAPRSKCCWLLPMGKSP